MRKPHGIILSKSENNRNLLFKQEKKNGREEIYTSTDEQTSKKKAIKNKQRLYTEWKKGSISKKEEYGNKVTMAKGIGKAIFC